MFQYVIDKKREEPSHPNIPSEVWNHCPTSYEIASRILTHRNSLWNDYIIKALNESSNQKTSHFSSWPSRLVTKMRVS
jgi:hypothetical protein